ncbi:hypothetical protein [Thermoflexus sp.]|jgi:hypothetical protein|uniref:hypothetical protein n=1 Tax=Thermoflexus sp. TaxID=1969742 RepID=UPI003C00E549
MSKHVVGYLKWEDFICEVGALRPKVVRVQTYHRTAGEQPPFLVRFWAEAAFVSGDEVHVARLPLGAAYEFELRDPGTWERFAVLMRQAERLLHAALAPYGAEVRRGVYAGTDQLKIQTEPDGLWRLERDGEALRLVPEIPVEASVGRVDQGGQA